MKNPSEISAPRTEWYLIPILLNEIYTLSRTDFTGKPRNHLLSVILMSLITRCPFQCYLYFDAGRSSVNSSTVAWCSSTSA